jgi:hypothetical protein
MTAKSYFIFIHSDPYLINTVTPQKANISRVLLPYNSIQKYAFFYGATHQLFPIIAIASLIYGTNTEINIT